MPGPGEDVGGLVTTPLTPLPESVESVPEISEAKTEYMGNTKEKRTTTGMMRVFFITNVCG